MSVKTLSIIFLGLLLFGCKNEDPLLPNNEAQPLVQDFGIGRTKDPQRLYAVIEGNEFNAVSIRATTVGGNVLIEAYTPNEQLYINIVGRGKGVYRSSANLFNEIQYQSDTLSGSYSTFFAGNKSDGRIDIVEANSNVNVISGRFFGTLVTLDDDSISLVSGTFDDIELREPGFGSMSLDISKVSFSADQCDHKYDFINGQSTEVISSLTADSAYQVNLVFPNSIVQGSYGLDTSAVFGQIVNLNNGDIYKSFNGLINITSADYLLDEFSGTFNFNSRNASTGITKLVQNGTFVSR